MANAHPRSRKIRDADPIPSHVEERLHLASLGQGFSALVTLPFELSPLAFKELQMGEPTEGLAYVDDILVAGLALSLFVNLFLVRSKIDKGVGLGGGGGSCRGWCRRRQLTVVPV